MVHSRALLATNEPRLAHWIQPDAVLVCAKGRPPSWLRNASAAAPLPLRIICDDVDGSDGGGGGDAEGGDDEEGGGGGGGGGELFLWQLRRCGFERRQAVAGAEGEGGGEGVGDGDGDGGVVLSATVQTSDETQMCDALFDLPFGGVCARALPRFPSPRMLGPFGIGLITGPSGAAKSAILREHFGPLLPPFRWDPARAVGAYLGPRAARYVAAAAMEACAAEAAFEALSGGERAQAEVARALWWCEEGWREEAEAGDNGGGGGAAAAGRGAPPLLLLDEFGSAWDRATAARVAAALAAALREPGARARGAVLASCHCGFLTELAPDWVFEAASGTLARRAERQPEAPSSSEGGYNGLQQSSGEAAAAREEAERAWAHGWIPVGMHGGVEAWEAAARAAASWARVPVPAGVLGASGGTAVAVAAPRLELRLRRCGGGAWRRFAALHYKSAALSSHPGMRAHLVCAARAPSPPLSLLTVTRVLAAHRSPRRRRRRRSRGAVRLRRHHPALRRAHSGRAGASAPRPPHRDPAGVAGARHRLAAERRGGGVGTARRRRLLRPDGTPQLWGLPRPLAALAAERLQPHAARAPHRGLACAVRRASPAFISPASRLDLSAASTSPGNRASRCACARPS